MEETKLDEAELGVLSNKGMSKGNDEATVIPIHLDVQGLSYSVMIKKPLDKGDEGAGCFPRNKTQETFFLNNITTSFVPGTMTAIMGRYGS